MLKILVRLLTAMILVAVIYLIFTNTKYNSLQQLQLQNKVTIRLQNLPEIILPSKEETAGFQYELIKKYLKNLSHDDILLSDKNYDVDIFYSSDPCDTCIVINNQDLVLITNTHTNKSNDIEVLKIIRNINLPKSLSNNYELNYVDITLDDLINNLSNNLISHTVLTRSSYLFYKKYYPNLKIKKNIGNVNLVWNFINDDKTIQKNTFKYLELESTATYINTLKSKYYSRDTMSSYIFIGSRIFITDMIKKLPLYESIFKDASKKYSLDWKLLASISYQESKWNNTAISPTGVKGLMMLTMNTAKMMGVDRLKPSESIFGGAEYFTGLKNRYSSYNLSTQLNLALAAYNVGPNHINDIIILAKKNNINLKKWENLKKYLLKLNQKKYYKNMKYGYARGWEAVQYVENVKQYYDIITFLEDKDKENKKNILKEVPKTL